MTTTFFQAQHLTEGNPRARRSASTASNSEENMTVSSKVRCVDCDTGDSTSPLIESLLYSDEFSGVSFADEHFEQPQFGFDVLVFVVLHSQWGAVLLLNVPAGTRRQSLRRCEKKTFVSRFLIMQFQIFDIDKLFFSYLPFCLKNWSSNSFKFLRILFFSSLVSWSCSTSSCLWGEEKCFLNVSH